MTHGLTPAQRLQASRHAISQHLQGQGRSRRSDADATRGAGGNDEADAPSAGPAWWRIARHTLRVWWHNHPAYSAVLVAQPVLQRYASEKPLQVVGIAAAVGAAAVWLKPWRLVSVGALLAATMKSQDVSRLVVALMSQAMPPQERKDEAP